ncbi:MAG: ATP-binding cassette domain-containing protein [Candidatus Verstraetearchaeota archaeon]|nr:ATP-binding cassette domain-containing protein [Candidatus Verstraetearchaeota archaeon]
MIIRTFGITKKYKNLTAVDHIDLSIEEGEIFGLLGPNGAGKTTLLSMLATLLPPTEGTATVNGYDVRRDPGKIRSSIGMVFQTPSSDDILTGRENLYLHALMYGVPKEERTKRIEEALSLVDLTERAGDLVKTYSGGMRRRLELARGLLHRPKILFLDEPTLGLDPQTRQHIWDYIRRLAEEESVTIIITTHYMEEADSLCDRVAIIDHGSVKALDSPSGLKMKVGKSMIKARAERPDIDSIKRLPYVAGVSLEEGAVAITLTEAGAHLQEIISYLGVVSYVELREPTLNDVFLHITGKGIREESPQEWTEAYVRAGSG